MSELIYGEESYEIMGACFEVYRRMGRGFLEAVYQECLAIEFFEREIPVVAEARVPIVYKGRTLEQFYKADFVCYDKILIEVKAVSRLGPDHHAQVINYLRATGLRLGILLNFCSAPQLESERIVL